MVTYIERLQLSVTLPQDPPLEPPRCSFSSLVCDKLLARNCKDVIKLLQSSLLCFRNKEEDHDEGKDVQTGVEAECT